MSLSSVLSFESASTADNEVLLVTQDEWSPYTGKVSKQQVVRYLLSLLETSTYEMSVNCGMAGDALVVPIFCYPMVAGLDYTLYSSYGDLSECLVELIEVKDELVQFRLTSEETVDFPIKSIRSMEWVLDCLDANGDLTVNPELEVAGNRISTGGVSVYGTAKISYVTERHTYILTAPRRQTALDNNYSGVVVGVAQGNMPVVLELKMPPSVASFEADPDYVCGSGGSWAVKESSQEGSIPDVPGRSLITEKNYCDQLTIREYLE